ncbi:sensor histidine kinase [Micromonospora sp. NPDC047548]|uniref:sensor histidine kinase n=1 Tax=Micromonospora sp. NPDC047548 TaxID=3155624 RepID=UPI0033D30DAD
MDVTVNLPRLPLHDRVPAAVRAALAWGGAIASPFLLIITVQNGANIWWTPGLVEICRRYLLPAMVMALPVALLRRQPLTTLALLLAGSSVVTVTFASPWDTAYVGEIRYLQVLAVDLTVAYLAATRRRRISVAAAVVALAVQVVAEFVKPVGRDPLTGAVITLLAMVTVWMIGNSVRARRRYAEELRTQAASQAVTAERLRIARELHDMVAHSIGVIAIQAGMGSRVMDTQPAEARESLRVIEATSRETLAGLRRILGGLRRAEPSEASGAPLEPAPGLADLDQLAATTALAGLRVDVRWRGERRPIPGDIDLSAFRIIQEAVTNVVRHAGTDECRVTVEYQDDELHIEISDNGRGCLVADTGYGITGMRERVGLLHGEFSAGPRPEGGFRVAATLSLPDRVPAPAVLR